MRAFLLAAFVIAACNASGQANDEVTVRGRDRPYKGTIHSESSRGIEISGVKEPILAADIVDIVYEVTPVDARINLYRPAVLSEKAYYEPEQKNAAKRKANLSDAIKKYSEALAKVKEPAAKRHIEYKLGVLTADQALDESADLEPAIKRLREFKAKHPNSWQITSCLQLLGRLQAESKHYQDAEETYLELSRADVSGETRRDAELTAVSLSVKAGKYDAALTTLKALAAKMPKDSKLRGRVKIAEAECLVAAKKDAEGVALLRQLITDTTDKNLKALAYNTLGLCFYKAEQLKDALWEFLWVDVVYNQDKAEHAKALYYLGKIFDKLETKGRAQECRQILIGDRAFAGTEWQQQALRDAAKAP